MAPRARPAKLEEIDPHRTAENAAHERARIESGATGVPPDVAKEILTFLDSVEGTVKPQRLLTYMRTLPLVAQKIDTDFLSPNEETPSKFRKAYRDYAGWTVMSAGAIAMKFWTRLSAHCAYGRIYGVRVSCNSL